MGKGTDKETSTQLAVTDYDKLFESALAKKEVKEVLPELFRFAEIGERFIGRFEGKITDIPGINDSTFNVYYFQLSTRLIAVVLGAVVDSKPDLFKINYVYGVEFRGKAETRLTHQINTYRILEVGDYDELTSA